MPAMKRSDFLRRIATLYENCDGNGEKLIEGLVGLECIGTNRGVLNELRLAAENLDQLEILKLQIKEGASDAR
jgi:hypothetical protein